MISEMFHIYLLHLLMTWAQDHGRDENVEKASYFPENLKR